MRKKLKLRKASGMTIIETLIYITLSAIIICCTLTVMMAIVKKTDEENKSSFRINKLYSTFCTIEKFTKEKYAYDVSVKNNTIYFTNKDNQNECKICKAGKRIMFTINSKPFYFMHNEYYDASVDKFTCSKKDKLLYINIKLETGEMMKKCIHID